MRKLVARIGEWLKWRRVEVAERLVRSLGYGVYLRVYVVEAETRAAALVGAFADFGLAARVGKGAGRQVRWNVLERCARDVVTVLRELEEEGHLSPKVVGVEHVGVPLLGVLSRLLGLALTRGGSRLW